MFWPSFPCYALFFWQNATWWLFASVFDILVIVVTQRLKKLCFVSWLLNSYPSLQIASVCMMALSGNYFQVPKFAFTAHCMYHRLLLLPWQQALQPRGIAMSEYVKALVFNWSSVAQPSPSLIACPKTPNYYRKLQPYKYGWASANIVQTNKVSFIGTNMVL